MWDGANMLLKIFIACVQAAEDCMDDIDEIEKLRTEVISHADAPPGAMDAYAKYYRALCAMESRFPVSSTPGHVGLTFCWQDAFRPQRRTQQTNIHFEKAAVIFNLAAAASQRALSTDRKEQGGLIDSARGFQEAAGLFKALSEGSALKLDEPRPVDVSPECASMLEKLMLAQAQECVLEKASSDKKAAATLARIAKHAAVLYDDCHQMLSSKPLSDHFDRTWEAHTKVKALLHHIEAEFHNAADLREKDDIKGVANEIAQLRESKAMISTAKREAKSASQELQDNVASKERQVCDRLSRAEKENANIYLQRVPQAIDLPSVIPAALVKPLPPKTLDSTPESRSLFKGVVPEPIMKALSRYTDMVDGLIRNQVDKLESALDDVRLRLREMELPESLQYLEPRGCLTIMPESLREDLKVIEQRGGLSHLRELLSELHSLQSVTRSEIDAIDRELEAERQTDDEMRRLYGLRWNRPTSLDMTAGMRERLRGYRSNLSAALEADKQLGTKLESHENAFAYLSLDEVSRHVPILQAPMFTIDDTSPSSAVASLRAGLEGLSTLSAHRASLEEALRQRKASDDILLKLLSWSSNYEELFSAEIKKYDDLVRGVEENISKQASLLEMISTAYTTFAGAYGIDDWKRQCVNECESIRGDAKAFIALSDSMAEGVHFYTHLQEALQGLKLQAFDYCQLRETEKSSILSAFQTNSGPSEIDVRAQMASMNRNDGIKFDSTATEYRGQAQNPAAPSPPSSSPFHQQPRDPYTAAGYPRPYFQDEEQSTVDHRPAHVFLDFDGKHAQGRTNTPHQAEPQVNPLKAFFQGYK